MNSTHAGVGLGAITATTYLTHVLAYYQGAAAPAADEAGLVVGIVGAISAFVYAYVTRPRNIVPVTPIKEAPHA